MHIYIEIYKMADNLIRSNQNISENTPGVKILEKKIMYSFGVYFKCDGKNFCCHFPFGMNKWLQISISKISNYTVLYMQAV